MTIYEQIEKSIAYIESRMDAHAEIRGESGAASIAAAREAGMSLRSFSEWFWAVTGITFRDYVLRRRLERSRQALADSDRRILDIALDAGYRSHEAFSRAFQVEFGISPSACKSGRPPLRGLGRIILVKEMYMGVIVKELPALQAAYFDGFAPESEGKAHQALDAWMANHPDNGKKRRIFGYNIDRNGSLSCEPHNEGYRLFVTINDGENTDGAQTITIRKGKFLVTGIEGNFNDDPGGLWIAQGWERMNALIREKGYRPAQKPRWFEEELEPATQGNLRLDLYLEIGE